MFIWLLSSAVLAATAGLAYAFMRRRRLRATFSPNDAAPVFTPAAESQAEPLQSGLPARAQADAHLDIEFAAARRGRPLAVVLVEPDDLHAYHLINGSSAVEGVLRGLATLLRQHTRRMDVAAAYEAHSFIAILSGSGEDGALIFASRIQEQLHSAQNIVSLPNVSIGIACYSRELETPRDLLDAAEQALAQAKRDGGDRVRIYGRAVDVSTALSAAAADAVATMTADESAAAALDSAQVQERQLAAEMRTLNRELQQAVAASEARFREVVDTIHEVIFATDVDGRWQFLNRAWTMITGFAVEESVGRPLFEFLRRDDAREVEEAFQDVVSGVAAYYRHEGQWRTRAGEFRSIELRLRPTMQDGRVTGTSGVLLDVTDRRRAEEAQQRSEAYFRALIEHSADVLTAVNQDGTIRYVSPAIEGLLGYPAAAFIGRNAFELVHPDDLEPARDELQRLLTDQANAADIDVRMRHRDGHWKLLELSGRNLLHASVVGAVIISARDATERRRTEVALREAEEAVMRAQKMDAIARLAAGVAMEYEAQLRTIQAQAELLLGRYPTDNEARAALQNVFSAVAHASTITQRLRAVGREQQHQPASVDLNQLIGGFAPRLQRLVGEHTKLTMQLGAEMALVEADPVELEQVIFSLANHARAAMPNGGTLAIGTGSHDVKARDPLRRELVVGTYVVLTVTDTGVGMTEAQLAHAFEPFFSDMPSPASGLDLAAVYGVAKRAGGHVTLTSEPGSGSCVTVFLPVSTAASTADSLVHAG